MKMKNEWGKRILCMALIVLLLVQPQLVYGIGDSSKETPETQEQGVDFSTPQPETGNVENTEKPETPGESEPQENAGKPETPGESAPQENAGNPETPGESDPQENTGNPETPGESEPQENAGNPETPGESAPQENVGNPETPEDSEDLEDTENQEETEDSEEADVTEEEQALQEPSNGSLAGQTMKFVNLYWETDDLGAVEAVFGGGADEELAQVMESSDRGVYTTVIPSGDYSRVSFRKSGESAPLAESSYNYYGAVSLDSEVDTTSFIAEKNNTFYYDLGENPSYWGADPDYEVTDPGTTVTVPEPPVQISVQQDEENAGQEEGEESVKSIAPLMAPATRQEISAEGNPQPGEMVYAIDLDQREKYLAGEDADTYRVHIAFMREGHQEITDIEDIPAEQGEIYTMYEKNTGVYSAPFPAKVVDYGEIGFKLVTKEGQESPMNAGTRHFNFRGKQPDEQEKSKFGYFKYYSGYTDTYYMNTSQEDSYWGAHPSNADQSLDSQVLYINVEDGKEGDQSSNNIIADLDNMWISWNGMPEDDAYGYVEDQEKGIAGYKIKNELPHKWVRYFQFPKNSNATENTIITIQFKLKALNGASLQEEQKDKIYSYKFTYVPRSQRNCVNMDYIWEFNGQMWKHFEAGKGLDSRKLFFASIRNKYDKVWIRVANESGEYASREEIENWGAEGDWSNQWIKDHILELEDNGKVTIWLMLDKEEKPETYHKEEGKLFSLTIPNTYDKIQFRTKLGEEFYYSGEETISDESAYPCYYAYQVGKSSATVPETTTSLMGLTGYWASVYAANASGDQSVDIPEEEMEWEEGVYYVDTTMYDYYSDWEISGRKIAEWKAPADNNFISQQHRLQARTLNGALDRYYREHTEGMSEEELQSFASLYAAHNSNDDDTVHEYGKGEIPNIFTGVPYYNRDAGGGNDWKKTAVTKGLMSDKLPGDGNLRIASTRDVEMPFFSEDFLRGNNFMETAVGNVYKNVKFPIKLNDDGYWEFDSSKESDAFRLCRDVNEGYFMKRTNEPISFRGVNGFFPFNDRADWDGIINGGSKDDPSGKSTFGDNGMTRANYMFGSKFEFEFSLPEGKEVYDKNGDPQDITFEFQGDDDVWIYIDNQLVLDLGGNHDAMYGKINFTDGSFTIQAAKKENGQYKPNDDIVIDKDQDSEFLKSLSTGEIHKVTLFYMERGLYESNLKMTFNFPRDNRLTVEKQVDVETTRNKNEDDIFAGLLENMGGFNFNIKNLVTSGEEVKVEDTPGYRRPGESTVLFDAVTDKPKDATFTFEPDAGEVSGDIGAVRTITQHSEVRGEEPDEGKLLKIDQEELLNVNDRDYLRLSMTNLGADDRNAQNLYISFVDTNGHRVGGYAGSYGYNGESNTFITNEESIIRIAFKQMPGDANEFDWTKLDYMLIGIRRNNPETENASYEISYATFFKAMKERPPIGFYIDDSQISDYGSYSSGKLSPVDGAWYLKQNKGSDNKYDNGVSWNTEAGTFNLADGQRAVFTDKFRTGSYISLNENVNDKIFTTQWTLRENEQEIPAKYLLNTRNDITTVVNPLSKITEEYPFESVEGTVIGDERKEIIEPNWNKDNFKEPEDLSQTFVYRSYKDPDSSANIGVDLNVEVKNILKRGTITIKKKLTEEVQEDGTYKPAEFSFKIYYANVAGRALEKQLEPVDGDNRYLVQTVTVRTDEKGEGQTTVYNIPAGTQYWIEEVPANGTKLTKIEVEKQGEDVKEPHEGVIVEGIVNDNDYSNAYVVGTAYASNQVVTFTNNIEPFYMDIEKIWKDGLTDEEREDLGITEVHIRLERRVQGDSENSWVPVTKDYFNEDIADEEDYLILNENNDWKTTSSKALDVKNKSGDRYEYRIVEVDYQGIFKTYEVEYRVESNPNWKPDDEKKEYLHVTYQAINTPANLRLQKEWPNSGDSNMLSRIRVKLMASDQYDPSKPNAEVEWVCYKKLSNKNHICDTNCYVSMSKDSGWSASLRNLPRQNDNGKLYYYQLAGEQILIDSGWKDMTEAYGKVTYGKPVTVEKGQEGIATLTLSNEMNFGSIKLVKENKAGDKLKGAEFKIERLKEDKDESDKTKWKVDEKWSPKTATTNNQGEILFNQLQHGTYRITETKAPGGYLLNPEGIIITIPGGECVTEMDDVNVGVTDDGEGGAEHHIVLTVKNAELYQLPNSGGSGIYRYMISGVLLMIAAVFIIYNNKRKGEKA